MRKKLLLADDSVVIQKLVGLSFANEDVEIIATDNGDDALVKARETVPDMILADVAMPGISGYEVCEAIKQDAALAHIPVLLLTGTFEAFDEARSKAVGANGHITKPFEAQTLVSRVVELMNAPAPAAAAPAAPTLDVDSDFFDSNDGSLSGSMPPAEPAPIGESPILSESDDLQFEGENLLIDDPDASISGLFDEAGQGAGDEPQTQIFAAAPGETLSEASAPSTPATELAPPAVAPSPPALNPEPLAVHPEPPALHPEPQALHREPQALPPAPPALHPEPPALHPEPPALHPDDAEPLAFSPEAPASQAEATIVDMHANASGLAGDLDPLVGLADEFGLDDQLASAAAAASTDVDAEFGTGPMQADETIVAGYDDGNNILNPNRVSPDPNPAAGDDVFGDGPEIGIDSAVATAPTPAAPIHAPPEDSSGPSPAVTDLDQQLAEPASVDPLAAATTTATASGPKSPDVRPSSLAPDELDFAFDASEKQSNAEPIDPLEQSYSSLTEIAEPQTLAEPSPPKPNPLAADYDVSSSDLATAAVPPSSPPSTPSPADATQADESPTSAATDTMDTTGEPTSIDHDEAFAASEVANPPASSTAGNSVAPRPAQDPIDVPMPASESMDPMDDLRAAGGAADSAPGASISDLSPIMEQRIRDTLEKVAWEAFSDISEAIVKQVMKQVEKIAWEVIPQMAETLVREEIRIMKGEDD